MRVTVLMIIESEYGEAKETVKEIKENSGYFSGCDTEVIELSNN